MASKAIPEIAVIEKANGHPAFDPTSPIAGLIFPDIQRNISDAYHNLHQLTHNLTVEDYDTFLEWSKLAMAKSNPFAVGKSQDHALQRVECNYLQSLALSQIPIGAPVIFLCSSPAEAFHVSTVRPDLRPMFHISTKGHKQNTRVYEGIASADHLIATASPLAPVAQSFKNAWANPGVPTGLFYVGDFKYMPAYPAQFIVVIEGIYYLNPGRLRDYLLRCRTVDHAYPTVLATMHYCAEIFTIGNNNRVLAHPTMGWAWEAKWPYLNMYFPRCQAPMYTAKKSYLKQYWFKGPLTRDVIHADMGYGLFKFTLPVADIENTVTLNAFADWICFPDFHALYTKGKYKYYMAQRKGVEDAMSYTFNRLGLKQEIEWPIIINYIRANKGKLHLLGRDIVKAWIMDPETSILAIVQLIVVKLSLARSNAWDVIGSLVESANNHFVLTLGHRIFTWRWNRFKSWISKVFGSKNFADIYQEVENFKIVRFEAHYDNIYRVKRLIVDATTESLAHLRLIGGKSGYLSHPHDNNKNWEAFKAKCLPAMDTSLGLLKSHFVSKLAAFLSTFDNSRINCYYFGFEPGNSLNELLSYFRSIKIALGTEGNRQSKLIASREGRTEFTPTAMAMMNPAIEIRSNMTLGTVPRDANGLVLYDISCCNGVHKGKTTYCELPFHRFEIFADHFASDCCTFDRGLVKYNSPDYESIINKRWKYLKQIIVPGNRNPASFEVYFYFERQSKFKFWRSPYDDGWKQAYINFLTQPIKVRVCYYDWLTHEFGLPDWALAVKVRDRTKLKYLVDHEMRCQVREIFDLFSEGAQSLDIDHAFEILLAFQKGRTDGDVWRIIHKFLGKVKCVTFEHFLDLFDEICDLTQEEYHKIMSAWFKRIKLPEKKRSKKSKTVAGDEPKSYSPSGDIMPSIEEFSETSVSPSASSDWTTSEEDVSVDDEEEGSELEDSVSRSSYSDDSTHSCASSDNGTECSEEEFTPLNEDMPETITLHIILDENNNFDIDVSPTRSVRSVKAILSNKLATPPGAFKLGCGSIMLEEDVNLFNIPIGDQAVLYVIKDDTYVDASPHKSSFHDAIVAAKSKKKSVESQGSRTPETKPKELSSELVTNLVIDNPRDTTSLRSPKPEKKVPSLTIDSEPMDLPKSAVGIDFKDIRTLLEWLVLQGRASLNAYVNKPENVNDFTLCGLFGYDLEKDGICHNKGERKLKIVTTATGVVLTEMPNVPYRPKMLPVPDDWLYCSVPSDGFCAVRAASFIMYGNDLKMEHAQFYLTKGQNPQFTYPRMMKITPDMLVNKLGSIKNLLIVDTTSQNLDFAKVKPGVVCILLLNADHCDLVIRRQAYHIPPDPTPDFFKLKYTEIDWNKIYPKWADMVQEFIGIIKPPTGKEKYAGLHDKVMADLQQLKHRTPKPMKLHIVNGGPGCGKTESVLRWWYRRYKGAKVKPRLLVIAPSGKRCREMHDEQATAWGVVGVDNLHDEANMFIKTYVSAFASKSKEKYNAPDDSVQFILVDEGFTHPMHYYACLSQVFTKAVFISASDVNQMCLDPANYAGVENATFKLYVPDLIKQNAMAKGSVTTLNATYRFGAALTKIANRVEPRAQLISAKPLAPLSIRRLDPSMVQKVAQMGITVMVPSDMISTSVTSVTSTIRVNQGGSMETAAIYLPDKTALSNFQDFLPNLFVGLTRARHNILFLCSKADYSKILTTIGVDTGTTRHIGGQSYLLHTRMPRNTRHLPEFDAQIYAPDYTVHKPTNYTQQRLKKVHIPKVPVDLVTLMDVTPQLPEPNSNFSGIRPILRAKIDVNVDNIIGTQKVIHALSETAQGLRDSVSSPLQDIATVAERLVVNEQVEKKVMSYRGSVDKLVRNFMEAYIDMDKYNALWDKRAVEEFGAEAWNEFKRVLNMNENDEMLTMRGFLRFLHEHLKTQIKMKGLDAVMKGKIGDEGEAKTGQPVVASPKVINLIFSPVFRFAMKTLLASLKPHIIWASGLSEHQMWVMWNAYCDWDIEILMKDYTQMDASHNTFSNKILEAVWSIFYPGASEIKAFFDHSTFITVLAQTFKYFLQSQLGSGRPDTFASNTLKQLIDMCIAGMAGPYGTSWWKYLKVVMLGGDDSSTQTSFTNVFNWNELDKILYAPIKAKTAKGVMEFFNWIFTPRGYYYNPIILAWKITGKNMDFVLARQDFFDEYITSLKNIMYCYWYNEVVAYKDIAMYYNCDADWVHRLILALTGFLYIKPEMLRKNLIETHVKDYHIGGRYCASTLPSDIYSDYFDSQTISTLPVATNMYNNMKTDVKKIVEKAKQVKSSPVAAAVQFDQSQVVTSCVNWLLEDSQRTRKSSPLFSAERTGGEAHCPRFSCVAEYDGLKVTIMNCPDTKSGKHASAYVLKNRIINRGKADTILKKAAQMYDDLSDFDDIMPEPLPQLNIRNEPAIVQPERSPNEPTPFVPSMGYKLGYANATIPSALAGNKKFLPSSIGVHFISDDFHEVRDYYKFQADKLIMANETAPSVPWVCCTCHCYNKVLPVCKNCRTDVSDHSTFTLVQINKEYTPVFGDKVVKKMEKALQKVEKKEKKKPKKQVPGRKRMPRKVVRVQVPSQAQVFAKALNTTARQIERKPKPVKLGRRGVPRNVGQVIKPHMVTKNAARKIAEAISLPCLRRPIRYGDNYSTEPLAQASTLIIEPLALNTGSTDYLMPSADFQAFLFRDYLRNLVVLDTNTTGATADYIGVGLTPQANGTDIGLPSTTWDVNFTPDTVDEELPQQFAYWHAQSSWQPHGVTLFSGVCESAKQYSWFWLNATDTLTVNANISNGGTPTDGTVGAILLYFNNGQIVRLEAQMVLATNGTVYSKTFTPYEDGTMKKHSGYYALLWLNNNKDLNAVVLNVSSVLINLPATGQCWGHRCSPFIDLHLASVGSPRTIGTALLITNTSKILDKEGLIHRNQFPTNAHFTNYLTSVAQTFGDKNQHKIKSGDLGMYTWLRPDDQDSFKKREEHLVDSSNNLIWTGFPISTDESFAAVGFTMPDIDARSFELSYWTNFCYETVDPFFDVALSTYCDSDFSEAIRILKRTPDTTHNEDHISSISSTIANGLGLASQVANTIRDVATLF